MLVSAAFLPADQIEDVIRTVLENNPSLAESRLSLEEFLDGKPHIFQIENTSLSLGADYSASLEETPGFSPGLSGSVSLSVPVLSQLSVSSSYSFSDNTGPGAEDPSVSIGISYRPFADSTDIKSWNNSEYIKYLQLAQQIENLKSQAESFYISWITSKGSVEIAELRFSQAESSLANAEFRYQQGMINYQTYQNAVIDYTNRSIALTEAKRNLLNKRQDGLELFGNTKALDDMENWDMSYEDLKKRIDSFEQNTGIPVSAAIVQLQADLDSLKREQTGTWIWEPDLSLNLNTAIPLESLRISGQMSFSYNQIKAKDKKVLAEKIKNKELEIESEKARFELQKEVYQIAVDTAADNLSILELSHDLAVQNMESAQSGHALGVVSNDELITAQISLKQAGLDLMNGAASLLQALRSQALLYIEAAMP